jgi:hypothetical protein
MENQEELDIFLDTYELPKLNQENLNNLNRHKMSNEIKALIKRLPRRKSPRLGGFIAEYYQNFKKKTNNNAPETFQ